MRKEEIIRLQQIVIYDQRFIIEQLQKEIDPAKRWATRPTNAGKQTTAKIIPLWNNIE